MEEDRLVVSDTSPLLNLALIDQLQLLDSQFEEIIVPEQVWEEIQEGEKGRERIEIYTGNLLEVIDVVEDSLYREFRQRLDRGESAALSYAVRNNADLILIDEKEGRNAARNHDLKLTGVIGVLIKADYEDEIDLEKQLDKLREKGFWISEELYQKILKQRS